MALTGQPERAKDVSRQLTHVCHTEKTLLQGSGLFEPSLGGGVTSAALCGSDVRVFFEIKAAG